MVIPKIIIYIFNFIDTSSLFQRNKSKHVEYVHEFVWLFFYFMCVCCRDLFFIIYELKYIAAFHIVFVLSSKTVSGWPWDLRVQLSLIRTMGFTLVFNLILGNFRKWMMWWDTHRLSYKEIESPFVITQLIYHRPYIVLQLHHKHMNIWKNQLRNILTENQRSTTS